jgi:hypothetical protein
MNVEESNYMRMLGKLSEDSSLMGDIMPVPNLYCRHFDLCRTWFNPARSVDGAAPPAAEQFPKIEFGREPVWSMVLDTMLGGLG